jgi:hypothetical protein
MKRRAALGGLIITVLAVYTYVLFEWLFLVTQRGFMVSFDGMTRATALAVTPLALLLPSLAFLAVLILIQQIWPADGRPAGLGAVTVVLPAAAILTALVILLIDNFTYTVFRIGIVTAGPYARFLYIPLLAGVFAAMARTLNRTRQRWTRDGIPVWLMVLPLVLVAGSAGAGVARLAARVEALDVRQAATPARPWNVLLVTIDGVEARRMSAYGYERPTTPFIDRFRQRALVFENAFSNAGRTTGSITSILSSKPPSLTKVIFPPHILTRRDAFEHLPGELRRAGYETYQFSVRYYADGPDLNMRESFDHANGRDVFPDRSKRIGRVFPGELYFAERLWERISERMLYVAGVRPMVNHFKLIQLPTSIYGDQSDRERVDAAASAARHASRPFFIHVHLMGTHCCGFTIRRRVYSKGSNPERADLLDDALIQADGEVERLISRLEEQGRLRDTMVIITSDHSANWGTQERVPLLIYLPDDRSPEVETANVQLIDLGPTILDAVGLTVPPWMHGRSLLREAQAPAYIESIGEVEKEVVDADWERISRLRDPSPPRYGLSTIGAVVCDKWLEVNLNTGRMRTGTVDGHTAPCPAELLPGPGAVGMEMLLDLQRRGFELPIDRDDISAQYHSIGASGWAERAALTR